MTPEIKKILFATDLSKNSQIAFDFSLSLAEKYEARIYLLHVMRKLSSASERLLISALNEKKLKTIRSKHNQKARDVLIGKKQQVVDQPQLGISCKEESLEPESKLNKLQVIEIIAEGKNITEVILKEADTHGCDLIVMGSHAQTGLEKLFISDTIRYVLRKSEIPILVIPISGKEYVPDP
ncbi:universal stress protein [Desulfobacula sp.]|uniref:universal stress protein n=1 Tax=Desulfobacula sp. TaxID=2593537 RepID=UPI00260D40B6|nr:universal stress protein [Desulfobacula sp.]